MQYQLTICQGEPSRLGDPANAAVSAGCLLFLGMVQLLPGRGAKSQNCQVFCNVLVSINGNLSEVLEAPCSESALSISTGWAGTKFAPFVQLDNRDPVTIGPAQKAVLLASTTTSPMKEDPVDSIGCCVIALPSTSIKHQLLSIKHQWREVSVIELMWLCEISALGHVTKTASLGGWKKKHGTTLQFKALRARSEDACAIHKWLHRQVACCSLGTALHALGGWGNDSAHGALGKWQHATADDWW